MPILHDDAETPPLRDLPRGAFARLLTRIETERDTPGLAALLDRAAARPHGVVLGLTGPPGVGKSTLIDTLIRRGRARREPLGVIAVDPSSRLTGGALLGDRTRLASRDPEDGDVFIRSYAARDRLGGLSPDAIAATVLFRARFDVTIIETVGVGQSEGDIALVADTIVMAIQPGSGDALQFMKAGVMELPDVVVVTKADLGQPARRAVADVKGALSLAPHDPAWPVPVVLVSAAKGEGFDAYDVEIAAHRAFLAAESRLAARRAVQQRAWLDAVLLPRFGSAGVAAAAGLRRKGEGTFASIARIARILQDRLTAR